MMTIPNSTVGSHASVILRTWDNSTGSTFSNALFRAQVVVNFPTVGSAMSPSNFVLDSDFTGLVFFIPEPATVVLATLGLVGTFLVAGRRN